MDPVSKKRRLDINDDSSECSEQLRSLMNMGKAKEKLEDTVIQNEKNLDIITSRFETFENWELLPVEIKCMVIREVEFSTRFALMRCSKSMNEISKTVPIYISHLTVFEAAEMHNNEDQKQFEITVSSHPSRQVTFVFNGECDERSFSGTWMKNVGKGSDTEKKFFMFCYHEKEAFSFLKKILELANNEVDDLSVDTIRSIKKDNFPDKLLVKNTLEMTLTDLKSVHQWLEVAKHPLDEVSIRYFGDEEDKDEEFIGFSKHETMRNAAKLSVDLDDEWVYFMYSDLTCEELHFKLCFEGNIEFIERWIRGGVWDNFKALYSYTGYVEKFSEDMLEKIIYTEWSEQFRAENKILCEWIDGKFPNEEKKCYYIESNKKDNGATLVATKNKLSFLVTGKCRTSFAKSFRSFDELE